MLATRLRSGAKKGINMVMHKEKEDMIGLHCKLQRLMQLNYFLVFIFISSVGCLGHSNMTSNPQLNSEEKIKVFEQQQIVLGKRVSFQSRILKEQRTYQVHLPKSYTDNSIYPKKYPVLYVLDGESHFEYASGITDFMSAAGVTNNYQIPELIVVAIPNKEPGEDNRFRDYSPTLVSDYYSESGGGDLFLKFLRDELVPQIESEYRTIPLRILAGHSMGGLITVYDLLNTPSIFNAYIAMDPSLWWDNKLLLTKAKKLKSGLLRAPLYLSTYEKAQRKEESKEFVTTLAKNNPSPFRSKFQVFESETHGSLPVVSLYNGLLFVFDQYHPNLNEFVQEPTSIGNHFSNFSKLLGVAFLPPEDLIRDVCAHTLKENPEKAIACFQVNVANYPKSYNALNALAKVYASKGMKNEATEVYRKSLTIQPQNKGAVEGLHKLGD